MAIAVRKAPARPKVMAHNGEAYYQGMSDTWHGAVL